MSRRPLVPFRLALKVPFRPPPKTLVCKAMTLALVVAGFTVLGGGQALASHVGCGDTITTDTTLDSDLVNCPNNGIVIGADDITLDLNGHTIDGDGALVDPCPGFCDEGVDNTAGHSGVTIQGGSIQEFARGVIVLGASNTRLRHLSVANNTFIGITVGDDSAGSRIERNSITDNGLVGLALFASPQGGNRVERNRVSGSGEIGLLVDDAAGNRITNNTFSDNVEVGMLILGDRNQASRNRVLRNGDGMIIVGNDNAITRNHVTDAPGCPQDGEVGCGFGISFEGGAGNLIAHNFVTGARNAGIRVAAFEPDTPPAVDTIVRRNLVRAGDVDGILVESTATDSLLEGNIAIGSGDDGIDVDSPSTTLTRNLGLRNGDLGIEAVPGVTDGGGNKARGNGNPAQCTNIDCS
jgi:parallel beta-helix repeat protein